VLQGRPDVSARGKGLLWPWGFDADDTGKASSSAKVTVTVACIPWGNNVEIACKVLVSFKGGAVTRSPSRGGFWKQKSRNRFSKSKRWGKKERGRVSPKGNGSSGARRKKKENDGAGKRWDPRKSGEAGEKRNYLRWGGG